MRSGFQEQRKPGAVAWVFIAIGFVVMGISIAGVVHDAEETGPLNWFLWVAGAAVIHDVVLVPLVLLVGIGIAAIPSPRLRPALRWAVVVGALVSLTAWPVVMRWGASPRDPSELPLPAARNLGVLWAVLLLGAVAVAGTGAAWGARRTRRGRGVESRVGMHR